MGVLNYSFLLNNSETWVDVQKRTLDLLDDIQFMFLRCLFQTPRTCPKTALMWESGLLKMSHRIAIRKLMFYHHLTYLPSKALASEIMRIQEALSYPGLVKECKNLQNFYNLPSPDTLSKIQWKTLVKRRVRNTNRKELIAESKYLSKVDTSLLEKEEFKIRKYITILNVPDARLRFAIRSNMTRTVKMNYKGIKSYAESDWRCDRCRSPDTQEHIMLCEAYKKFRVGKDLTKDKDIVDFFRNVIISRSSDCSGT